MINHVENYLKWLKENMTQCEINKDIIEVTTPFLDRHNDYTQVYVKKINTDKFIVTDDGYTISDLSMSGMEFSTLKRKEMLQQTLNRLGIKYDEHTEELYVECSKANLPSVQHRLIQGMLDINDMFYLSAPNIRNIFFDDVKNFFDSNDIYYSDNISIVGKSGFNHSYNFLLQRNKDHPQRFIKLMNMANRSNAERYIFAWDDIMDARKPSIQEIKLIVFINDGDKKEKKVGNSIISGFRQYNIEPVLWSNRMADLEKFA